MNRPRVGGNSSVDNNEEYDVEMVTDPYSGTAETASEGEVKLPEQKDDASANVADVRIYTSKRTREDELETARKLMRGVSVPPTYPSRGTYMSEWLHRHAVHLCLEEIEHCVGTSLAESDTCADAVKWVKRAELLDRILQYQDNTPYERKEGDGWNEYLIRYVHPNGRFTEYALCCGKEAEKKAEEREPPDWESYIGKVAQSPGEVANTYWMGMFREETNAQSSAMGSLHTGLAQSTSAHEPHVFRMDMSSENGEEHKHDESAGCPHCVRHTASDDDTACEYWEARIEQVRLGLQNLLRGEDNVCEPCVLAGTTIWGTLAERLKGRNGVAESSHLLDVLPPFDAGRAIASAPASGQESDFDAVARPPQSGHSLPFATLPATTAGTGEGFQFDSTNRSSSAAEGSSHFVFRSPPASTDVSSQVSGRRRGTHRTAPPTSALHHSAAIHMADMDVEGCQRCVQFSTLREELQRECARVRELERELLVERSQSDSREARFRTLEAERKRQDDESRTELQQTHAHARELEHSVVVARAQLDERTLQCRTLEVERNRLDDESRTAREELQNARRQCHEAERAAEMYRVQLDEQRKMRMDGDTAHQRMELAFSAQQETMRQLELTLASERVASERRVAELQQHAEWYLRAEEQSKEAQAREQSAHAELTQQRVRWQVTESGLQLQLQEMRGQLDRANEQAREHKHFAELYLEKQDSLLLLDQVIQDIYDAISSVRTDMQMHCWKATHVENQAEGNEKDEPAQCRNTLAEWLSKMFTGNVGGYPQELLNKIDVCLSTVSEVQKTKRAKGLFDLGDKLTEQVTKQTALLQTKAAALLFGLLEQVVTGQWVILDQNAQSELVDKLVQTRVERREEDMSVVHDDVDAVRTHFHAQLRASSCNFLQCLTDANSLISSYKLDAHQSNANLLDETIQLLHTRVHDYVTDVHRTNEKTTADVEKTTRFLNVLMHLTKTTTLPELLTFVRKWAGGEGAMAAGDKSGGRIVSVLEMVRGMPADWFDSSLRDANEMATDMSIATAGDEDQREMKFGAVVLTNARTFVRACAGAAGVDESEVWPNMHQMSWILKNVMRGEDQPLPLSAEADDDVKKWSKKDRFEKLLFGHMTGRLGARMETAVRTVMRDLKQNAETHHLTSSSYTLYDVVLCDSANGVVGLMAGLQYRVADRPELATQYELTLRNTGLCYRAVVTDANPSISSRMTMWKLVADDMVRMDESFTSASGM